jgi:hypothetical protein
VSPGFSGGAHVGEHRSEGVLTLVGWDLRSRQLYTVGIYSGNNEVVGWKPEPHRPSSTSGLDLLDNTDIGVLRFSRSCTISYWVGYSVKVSGNIKDSTAHKNTSTQKRKEKLGASHL